MKRWVRQLALICITTLGFEVHAHPVSYTDAWVRVGDTIEVKLNIFFHDVDGVSPPIDETSPEGKVDAAAKLSTEAVMEAINSHGNRLGERLKLFGNGEVLTGEVIGTPHWKPNGDVVDLVSEGAVRLSWRLRFALPTDDLKTLTFVHHFRGTQPEQNGELRLQLQTPESRRISATIPPDRPYTILLAAEADKEEAQDELNLAQSRLIFSPRRIVHEFTAPLSRLTIAAEAGREMDEDRNSYVVSNEFVSRRTNEWFTDHVALVTNDRRELQLIESSTQLFPGGIPDPEEAKVGSDGSSGEAELPLMGTVVGVRQVFLQPASSDSCSLHFSETPGDFTELTVNTVTATGETSALAQFDSVADTASGASSTLDFVVDIDAFTPQLQANPSLPPPPVQPLVISELQFNQSRALMTLAAMVVAMTVMLRWTREWSTTRRTLAVGIMLTAAVAATASTFVQEHHEVQPTSVKAAFKHVLNRIYHAVNIRNRREALNELDTVLEDELLETTFLEVTKTLEEDEDGALVSVNSVSIDNVEAVAATSQTSVSAKVSWQVTGTVCHWGHIHDRIHQIRGKAKLVLSEEHWKISSLQLLGSEVKMKNSGS